jgi:hypothetical protein
MRRTLLVCCCIIIAGIAGKILRLFWEHFPKVGLQDSYNLTKRETETRRPWWVFWGIFCDILVWHAFVTTLIERGANGSSQKTSHMYIGIGTVIFILILYLIFRRR